MLTRLNQAQDTSRSGIGVAFSGLWYLFCQSVAHLTQEVVH